jgi:translation initiation factor 4E
MLDPICQCQNFVCVLFLPFLLLNPIVVSPFSYRLNIWTKDAPEDLRTPSPALDRILKIGRHFKQEVLGFSLESKLPGASHGPGGFSTEIEFQSHKESSKKSKDPNKKIIL